jgi:hypothetical protein
VALIVLSLAVLGLYFWRSPGSDDEGGNSLWPGQVLLLGGLLLVLGGIPFWVTGLPIQLDFPTNRFTVPSIPGAAFLLTGLIGLLDSHMRKWRFLPDLLVAILVAFSIGHQFQAANAFRRDWDQQTRFLQQLTGRIPALQRGTLLLANDLPSGYVSDNSITAPINWIYDPGYRGGSMPYLLYFPSVRLGTDLPGLEKGHQIVQDYLVAPYFGNTAGAVALYYNPPACLRVLDPRIDSLNATLPLQMREASKLTDLHRIVNSNQAVLPGGIIQPESASTWCSYYEQAALAAQAGDWNEVARLAEKAFALGDTPSDPAERFTYIEGYAHTGKWDRAVELTRDSALVTPLIHPSLCALWQRIHANTPDSAQKTAEEGSTLSLLDNCTIP